MVTWDNLDTLASFQNLSKTGRIDLKKVMSGENGAERVKNYSIPMAEGIKFSAMNMDCTRLVRNKKDDFSQMSG